MKRWQFKTCTYLLPPFFVPLLLDPLFEIPCAELREGDFLTHVSVDVVSPGYSPILMPGIRIIRQREYQKVFPFIVITLYEVDMR